MTEADIDELAHEIAEDAAKAALSSFCVREALDGAKTINPQLRLTAGRMLGAPSRSRVKGQPQTPALAFPSLQSK